MKNATYDVVVVGSGAGGATLARELIRKKLQNIVILEKGKRESSIGTLKESARYYDGNAFLRQPTRSKEGVILWRTLMAGGSTFVSCGNGVRCLESELKEHGIELSEEFTEAEKEMKIKPMKEEKLSEGTLQLREAAKQLGYAFDPMPKFIDLEKCTGCGGCYLDVYAGQNGRPWHI